MRGFKKFCILFLCAVLPVAVAVGYACWQWVNNRYTVQISMNGESVICIEYGAVYKEPGAVAQSWGSLIHKEHINVPVQISGNVDTQVVGDYTVTYRSEDRGATHTVNRVVQVRDTTAPEIVLISDPEARTKVGESYEEEGFSATDNYDGDITQKVVCKEENGVVTYTVTDSSGNVASATREIQYYDPDAPEIKLNGPANMAMQVGKPFKDPGFTATDNLDGDVTNKVEIKGVVNSNVPGTYTLEYVVTDSYNNVTSVKRTVAVKTHPVQEYVENPEKVIYLTFDDGPGPDTVRLLEILDKYNVKATFFVVNTAFVNTIAKIHEQGHAIGIHTATHIFREVYANEEAYFADMYKMQNIIKEITGEETMLLRFPGGSSNTIRSAEKGIMTRLTKLVKEKGFRYFDWDVDSKDTAGAKTPEEVFHHSTTGIEKREVAVLLQHDIKDYSVDAVEDIILWGLENGYTFLPLDMDSPECEHNVYN